MSDRERYADGGARRSRSEARTRGDAEQSDRTRDAAARKRRRRPTRRFYILYAILTVAIAAGAFAAGWHFGVDSTRFKGNILLVNESHRLDADYVPEDLVTLYTQPHAFRMAASDIQLTRQTYEAAQRMFKAAEDADMNGYIITSGYRSYHRQEEVYAESGKGKAQLPGASEHQTGMAFDVTVETAQGFENTPQYAWLNAHAHEYGFIQRYPANKSDVTGITYEPWHYRYVGVEAATKMHETGQTLEEFLEANR